MEPPTVVKKKAKPKAKQLAPVMTKKTPSSGAGTFATHAPLGSLKGSTATVSKPKPKSKALASKGLAPPPTAKYLLQTPTTGTPPAIKKKAGTTPPTTGGGGATTGPTGALFTSLVPKPTGTSPLLTKPQRALPPPTTTTSNGEVHFKLDMSKWDCSTITDSSVLSAISECWAGCGLMDQLSGRRGFYDVNKIHAVHQIPSEKWNTALKMPTTLVWHGTSAAKLSSILSNNMSIVSSSSSASVASRATRRLFGDGLYFTEAMGKAARHIPQPYPKVMYILLSEISIADSVAYTKDDEKQYKETNESNQGNGAQQKLKAHNANCLRAAGKWKLSKICDGVLGSQLAVGEPVEDENALSYLNQPEDVVYDAALQVPRAVVELHYTGK